MDKSSLRPIIMCILLAGFLTACTRGAQTGPASDSFATQLQAVSDAVVGASGYTKEAVNVTANLVHLRIEIADQALVSADQVSRETKAVDMVAAAERAMASQPEFAGVQAVSVAILHSSVTGRWHAEDVLDFRKGPNGRFSIHGTS